MTGIIIGQGSTDLTMSELWSLLTMDETAALTNARLSDRKVFSYMERFILNGGVSANEPQLLAFVLYLDEIGVIAQGRAEQVLNGVLGIAGVTENREYTLPEGM